MTRNIGMKRKKLNNPLNNPQLLMNMHNFRINPKFTLITYTIKTIIAKID